ncbi:hypothetical protein H180DRAFT_03410 [Streptomyces sp. WMMB 322]|nr:hypothetical protein H180DRAFT_03410 [Streptomyces sp. WMMB 322]
MLWITRCSALRVRTHTSPGMSAWMCPRNRREVDGDGGLRDGEPGRNRDRTGTAGPVGQSPADWPLSSRKPTFMQTW